jgi:hypothetical protein
VLGARKVRISIEMAAALAQKKTIRKTVKPKNESRPTTRTVRVSTGKVLSPME